jgi:hypothetical protein
VGRITRWWAEQAGLAPRRLLVRKVCETTLVTVMLLAACTDGGPEPKTWELAEAQPSREAHAGFEHQPERSRSIAPGSQPRLELVARYVTPEQDGLCPYEVEYVGFPAIAQDGTTIVDVNAFIPGNADEVDAVMQLSWLDQDRVAVDTIYTRSDDRPTAEDSPGCTVAVGHVREQVDALNAKLARRTWRPLEQLDAFYSSPGFAIAQERFGWAEDEVLASLPGDERPIEVFYHHASFVARVRGIEVLHTIARPDWRQTEDEFCLADPQIHAVEFDRFSGVALVRYNYSNGGCLCDDRDYVGRITLSGELLAMAKWRSTAKFVAAQHERMAADQSIS